LVCPLVEQPFSLFIFFEMGMAAGKVTWYGGGLI